jgi:hypothetical protein
MNPLLYQINTRCWLRDLSDKRGEPVTLASLPEEEFAMWERYGFTHIWLMGVWKTGPKALALAINHPDLRAAYDEMIPGWTPRDVGGSPYSIAGYEVPEAMGGDEGLKAFREKLNQRGMKLILDFVPNHLGYDHPWIIERPELFVQSPAAVDGTFEAKTPDGVKWIAHAKDPFFPPWTDVAQLDYRKQITRDAMQELLFSVASRCDGVRCDMAMLLLNEVMTRTWSHMPCDEPMPKTEFWDVAIPFVKQAVPGFIFMAEVYWGLEGRLQHMGFNYTYDKQLYDELHWRHTTGIQHRLTHSPADYVASGIHFLENHDEPRVAAALALPEHRAAALLILTLPGMRFLHDGQLTGAKIKIPVQLARRPVEPVNPEIQEMYDQLLTVLKTSAAGNGRGRILKSHAAWHNNPSGQNIVAVQWQTDETGLDLAVVNLAGHRSQCYLPLKVAKLSEHVWEYRDLLSDDVHERSGRDLAASGLYVDLEPHAAQMFRFKPVKS